MSKIIDFPKEAYKQRILKLLKDGRVYHWVYISNYCKVPLRPTMQILNELVEKGIVEEISRFHYKKRFKNA